MQPALFHCFRFDHEHLITEPEPARWDDEARRAYFERWKETVLDAAAGAKLLGKHTSEGLDLHLALLMYSSHATLAMPSAEDAFTTLAMPSAEDAILHVPPGEWDEEEDGE